MKQTKALVTSLLLVSHLVTLVPAAFAQNTNDPSITSESKLVMVDHNTGIRMYSRADGALVSERNGKIESISYPQKTVVSEAKTKINRGS